MHLVYDLQFVSHCSICIHALSVMLMGVDSCVGLLHSFRPPLQNSVPLSLIPQLHLIFFIEDFILDIIGIFYCLSPPPECMTYEGRDFVSFTALPYPQCLELHPAHSRN